MKIEDVLPDLRDGKSATLSQLPGNIFTYENDKIFATAEKVKKEFTQLEDYLGSDGWNLVEFDNDTVNLSLTDLKTQWSALIVPDSNFSGPQTSAKFIAFAKALGY